MVILEISAVIVAGGMGKRLGKSIPKAFVEINNREIFTYSLTLFESMKIFKDIVIVVPKAAVKDTEHKIANLNLSGNITVVEGGAERHNSVYNGVIATDSDYVLIHDSARPFVTKKVVEDLINDIGNSASVITATPVVDTVRNFSDNICGKTVDRSKLIAVGTPQLFNRDTLIDCFHKAEDLDLIPTDEAMLLEQFGRKVRFVYGDRLNFKVTTKEDLDLAEALIAYGVK